MRDKGPLLWVTPLNFTDQHTAHAPYEHLESTCNGKQDMPTVDTCGDTNSTHQVRNKLHNVHA